jgi:hypothetical protein
MKHNLRRYLGWTTAIVLISVVVRFYFWAADRQSTDWVSPAPAGYNAIYAEGLLAGHLYMKKPPPPEMAKLADPYDPAQYAPYYTFDLSYYKGHTYSYFGVAPVLLLYAPWTLLTGTYLSDQFGVAVFTALGFGLSLALLAAVRRCYLPRASPWLLVLGAMVLAVGNLSLVLFWPPYYAQAVQACARCCQIAALGAVFLALQPERRTIFWLGAASFAAGLMVVARPIFLPSVFLLVPPWLLALRRAAGEGPDPGNASERAALPRRWQITLAVALPITAIGLGLMWFNYARFGSPLEFGTTYQQFGTDLRDTPLFSLGYFGDDAIAHLFHLRHPLRYFPFINYQGGEPLGALIMLPFIWLAGLLGFGWNAAADRPAFRAFALAAVIAPLGIFAMLCSYYLALARHEVDFVIPLCWLAALGLLAAGHAWRGHSGRRRALSVVATLLAAANVLATVGFAASYRYAGDYPLGQYPTLARLLNQPVYLWEKLRGENPGNTLRMKVIFPLNRPNTVEPLLYTGADGFDLIYVHYLDPGQASLGYNHAELGAVEGAPFALDQGVHAMEITFGSLCPPPVHPVFAHWPPAAIFRARHQLTVKLDGAIQLDRDAIFHLASSGDVWVGDAPPTAGLAKFSGRILEVQRLPLAPSPPRIPAWPAGGAAFDLQFSNRRLGRSDPLLSAGSLEAGDLLFVKYPDADHIQFGFFHVVHAEGIPVLGQILPTTDGERIHHLEWRVTPEKSVVRFDGKSVLEQSAPPAPAPANSVYFGIQGFSAPTEPIFGGQISAIHTLPK